MLSTPLFLKLRLQCSSYTPTGESTRLNDAINYHRAPTTHCSALKGREDKRRAIRGLKRGADPTYIPALVKKSLVLVPMHQPTRLDL